MEKTFQDTLRAVVELYSSIRRNRGLPYITHSMEVMCARTHISEKILALVHDYGEFGNLDELLSRGVPFDFIERAKLLSKPVEVISSEDSSVYKEYIWNLFGDKLCRKVKYSDLSTNDAVEESPFNSDRIVDKKCSKTLALLADAENGKVYFKSKSFLSDVFSNFYPEEIIIDGEIWKSCEHFYQAAKFSTRYGVIADDKIFDAIKNAESASEAKEIADTNFNDIQKALWAKSYQKYFVTVSMLNVKFAKGTRLRELLDKTKGLELIHESRKDMYWGQNREGKGQNYLGKILTQIRDASEYPMIYFL